MASSKFILVKIKTNVILRLKLVKIKTNVREKRSFVFIFLYIQNDKQKISK